MKTVLNQSISDCFTCSQISRFLSVTMQCVMGSLFLGLMSQFSVNLPFTPIPITLQTFALFLLVIAQGKNKATYSVGLYLMQATMGLPVLNGGLANPAWLLFPTSGYLIGFLGCTWVSGYLIEKRSQPSFLWTMMSLGCGQLVIYTLGTAYLSYYVGLIQAFGLGVTPFITGAAIKLCAASCSSKPISFVTHLIKSKSAFEKS